MKFKKKKVIMPGKEISAVLKRIAREIAGKFRPENLAIVGIQTRGVHLSQRIAREIKKITRQTIPTGVLDITLYRDDVNSISHQPIVKETNLGFDLNGKDIILVDDVIFTGRTVRAALDALIDFGRPNKIKLFVLIDRGGRELPIQPDFVGKYFPTARNELVLVNLKEVDKKDCVILVKVEK